MNLSIDEDDEQMPYPQYPIEFAEEELPAPSPPVRIGFAERGGIWLLATMFLAAVLWVLYGMGKVAIWVWRFACHAL